jgi:hypothetical protein
VEDPEGARQEADSGGGPARAGSRWLLGAIGLAVWLVSEVVPTEFRGLVLGTLAVVFLIARFAFFGKRTVSADSQGRIERLLDEGEDKARISVGSSRSIEPR